MRFIQNYSIYRQFKSINEQAGSNVPDWFSKQFWSKKRQAFRIDRSQIADCWANVESFQSYTNVEYKSVVSLQDDLWDYVKKTTCDTDDGEKTIRDLIDEMLSEQGKNPIDYDRFVDGRFGRLTDRVLSAAICFLENLDRIQLDTEQREKAEKKAEPILNKTKEGQDQKPSQGQAQKPAQDQKPSQSQAQKPSQEQKPAQGQAQKPAQEQKPAQGQKETIKFEYKKASDFKTDWVNKPIEVPVEGQTYQLPLKVSCGFKAEDCDELHAFQNTKKKKEGGAPDEMEPVDIGNMAMIVKQWLDYFYYSKGIKPEVSDVDVQVNGMQVDWNVTISESKDGKAWIGFSSRGAGCDGELTRAESNFKKGQEKINGKYPGCEIVKIKTITHTDPGNGFHQIFFKYTKPGEQAQTKSTTSNKSADTQQKKSAPAVNKQFDINIIYNSKEFKELTKIKQRNEGKTGFLDVIPKKIVSSYDENVQELEKIVKEWNSNKVTKQEIIDRLDAKLAEAENEPTVGNESKEFKDAAISLLKYIKKEIVPKFS